MADPSIKRRLAGRVAESTGIPVERADLVLRAFYEEMLRATHQHICGPASHLRLDGVGRFQAAPSRRGCRHPKTGEALAAHWAFRFSPSKLMIDRCAEIRTERGG